MLTKYWYIIPMVLIVTYGYFTIHNLRVENKELSTQVESFQLKAESNAAKAKAFDNDALNKDQRHYQDNEFKKVIRNDPKSETSLISNVMLRALSMLPTPERP